MKQPDPTEEHTNRREAICILSLITYHLYHDYNDVLTNYNDMNQL
uniref:Uncharacterized protein n=1 Tax=Anguilla anguilla TaxID=7936 RepID=A0A0E9RWG2_ANGAN